MRFSYLLFLVILISCSSHQKQERSPSQAVVKSCFEVMRPLISQFQEMALNSEALIREGKVSKSVWDKVSGELRWKEAIYREGMSEDEEQMGLLIISKLKEAHPHEPYERILSRYHALINLCQAG